MTVQTDVVELESTDPMLREVNRGLMVRWINADLANRAHHDVGRSIVIYDEAKTFVTATTEGVWSTNAIRETAYRCGARFWSKGIV